GGDGDITQGRLNALQTLRNQTKYLVLFGYPLPQNNDQFLDTIIARLRSILSGHKSPFHLSQCDQQLFQTSHPSILTPGGWRLTISAFSRSALRASRIAASPLRMIAAIFVEAFSRFSSPSLRSPIASSSAAMSASVVFIFSVPMCARVPINLCAQLLPALFLRVREKGKKKMQDLRQALD